ncbi:hypothetical protein Tco_0111631 [Tanacetum coccineum]
MLRLKQNDAILKNVQNQNQGLQNQMTNVTSLLTSLCSKFDDLGNSNQPSSSSSLPSNTIPNPRNEAKAITTRSGVSYDDLDSTAGGGKGKCGTKDTANEHRDCQHPPTLDPRNISKTKEPKLENLLSLPTKPNLLCSYPSRLIKPKIRERMIIIA